MLMEEGDESKKVVLMEEGEQNKKASVFVHVLDPGVWVTGVASYIYKLEIDVKKYLNPSTYFKFTKTPSSSIKPIFRFSIKKNFYPEGMSCVSLGSKLYFMGGSIGYVIHMLGLEDYDADLTDGFFSIDPMTKSPFNFSIDPMTSYVEDNLCYYPPMVSVFDCDTCSLMPEDSISPMISGKYKNPITFGTNGQIFVLSSEIRAPGMVAFETINPNKWINWKELEEPPEKFFSCELVGSALINSKFLITSDGWSQFYMFSFDISSGNWAARIISSYIPQMYGHSVFVSDTFYSVASGPLYYTKRENNFPVVSFGPLDSTLLHQDGIDVDSVVLDCLNKYSLSSPNAPISPSDWPVYASQSGFSSRCLIHLGGQLKGTDTTSTCFGFMELFIPCTSHNGSECNTQCELRFVAFEAYKSTNGHAPFRATTIDACQFSTDILGIHRIAYACAYIA